MSRLSRPELRARKESEDALAARVASFVGKPMRVTLTRNRNRLLSLRRCDDGVKELRMHAALAAATDAELQALAAWVVGEPGSLAAARTVLARHGEEIDRVAALRAKPTPSTVSAGRHHDLISILHELKSAFFPDIPPVYIGWSGRIGPARRRRLGSWTSRGRLVRIHCMLDSPDVPEFFVASVVHHELCHAALEPGLTPMGRRRLHGREFRALEAQFPRHEEAQEWERRHVGRLLRG